MDLARGPEMSAARVAYRGGPPVRALCSSSSSRPKQSRGRPGSTPAREGRASRRRDQGRGARSLCRLCPRWRGVLAEELLPLGDAVGGCGPAPIRSGEEGGEYGGVAVRWGALGAG